MPKIFKIKSMISIKNIWDLIKILKNSKMKQIKKSKTPNCVYKSFKNVQEKIKASFRKYL